jgi:tRNA nucleotidyltransferase (CCA-adding enzyme)
MSAGQNDQARARWEHFCHVADLGVRGYGRTMEEAFSGAAMALTAAVTDPAAVAPLTAVEIDCAAPDVELLLAEWLNALVYEMSTRRMLFSRFQPRISDGRLRATAWGEPVERERHQPAVEVKGATYTELHVGRDAAGEWIAQCVIDV